MSPPNNTPHEILSTLAEIETQLAGGDIPTLQAALDRVVKIEKELLSQTDENGNGDPSIIVAALTARGHIERAIGSYEPAETTYQRALDHLKSAELEQSMREQRAANLWTYRGLAALSAESESCLRAAVESFDQSIAIRQRTCLESDDQKKNWGLAAAWMNRGDALEKMGSIENLHEAIQSFEISTRLLADLDPISNPAILTRIALAYMKRGAALAKLSAWDGSNRSRDSLESYSQAVTMLRSGAQTGAIESIRMLAVALFNKCRTRLHLGQGYTPEGESEIREAISIVKEIETKDFNLLELGLSSRVMLCKIIELDPDYDLEKQESEITDLAEEGLTIAMAMAALHHSPIPPNLHPILGQLFRTGAEAYFRFQPQFLAEYLLDHLDPQRNPLAFAGISHCHEAAVEIIWKGIATFQKDGFTDFGTDRFSRRLDQQSEWQQCRERLAELREKYLNLENFDQTGSDR